MIPSQLHRFSRLSTWLLEQARSVLLGVPSWSREKVDFLGNRQTAVWKVSEAHQQQLEEMLEDLSFVSQRTSRLALPHTPRRMQKWLSRVKSADCTRSKCQDGRCDVPIWVVQDKKSRRKDCLVDVSEPAEALEPVPTMVENSLREKQRGGAQS